MERASIVVSGFACFYFLWPVHRGSALATCAGRGRKEDILSSSDAATKNDGQGSLW